MSRRFAALAAGVAAAFAIASPVTAQTPNQVVGTWRPVSATLEVNGTKSHPYGPEPQGMLVFTTDMHFVELLRDPRVPRSSNHRLKAGVKSLACRSRRMMPRLFSSLHSSYAMQVASL